MGSFVGLGLGVVLLDLVLVCMDGWMDGLAFFIYLCSGLGGL